MLFSYCVRIDDGAAPNPFWGVCTLVICKPAIRRIAHIGDWVVGTGSRRSPIGDTSGHVVYAMRVNQAMSMKDYDIYARDKLPGKVPEWEHFDVRRRLGDAIYDFSDSSPRLRRSVHDGSNRSRDLSGKNALLSNHFFYFGDQPIPLPKHLRGMVLQGRGHRSQSNEPFIERFLEWLYDLGKKPNVLHGHPQYRMFPDEEFGTALCNRGLARKTRSTKKISKCI
jgi:Nucleotide modification associated domain 2